MSESLTATEHQAVQLEERVLSEVLLDTCWKSLERATNHFEKLDGKAGSLGGFVGVMLTVVLTISPNVFVGGHFQFGFALFAQLLYLVATVLLAVSLYHCTRVMNLREVQEVPLALDTVKTAHGLNSSPTVDSEFRYRLASLVAAASDDHHVVSRDKMKFLKLANTTLVWAVGVIIAAGLSFALHMTLKTYEPNKQSITEQR